MVWPWSIRVIHSECAQNGDKPSIVGEYVFLAGYPLRQKEGVTRICKSKRRRQSRLAGRANCAHKRTHRRERNDEWPVEEESLCQGSSSCQRCRCAQPAMPLRSPFQKMTPRLPKQRDGGHHGMPANGTEKPSAAPSNAAVEMATAVEYGR